MQDALLEINGENSEEYWFLGLHKKIKKIKKTLVVFVFLNVNLDFCIVRSDSI